MTDAGNDQEKNDPSMQPVKISRDMLERSTTGSVPGLTRQQERSAMTPPDIPEQKGNTLGVGAISRSVASIRNIAANNAKLSAVERERFNNACDMYLAVAVARDKTVAGGVNAQIEAAATMLRTRFSEEMLARQDESLARAQMQLLDEKERVDGMQADPALKEMFMTTALQAYNQRTEVVREIFGDAVRNVLDFGNEKKS